MALYDYSGALKQGRRQYQDALQKGNYPYLPVLDDILSYTEIVSEVSLGVMDIPLSKIVGTKTEGRTRAFAHNFMPLLPEKSEFGAKWASLYDHQINEGIHDPIVAYEFMNKFYVQEGNKRVSVMKYVGAYSIMGQVTRLIPKKTDDKENKLYYEFLDFFQVSFNCDVWFSKEGSYKELLEVMGKEPERVWDDEERLSFKTTYDRFAKAFTAAGGDKLDLTCSDAFLIYVKISGYTEVEDKTEKEMLSDLQKMWKEVQLASSGSQVELIEDPEEEEAPAKKPSLLNWLLPIGTVEPSMLKIGFIYTKTADTSSWTYAHELGRMHLEQAFDGKMKTLAFDRANTDDQVEEGIEQAVEAGCNVIFTTTPQMVNQSVRSAIKHPEVRIYNCSIGVSYTSICTYYPRMYECKFLMGAIAAAMSKTDQLGYVADYPIYGTMSNINAFALGARMINPDVKIRLEWSRVKNHRARQRLAEEGIVFISGDDMITPEHASREYGLYMKREDGSVDNLAVPIWHWGKFYERIVKNICRGASEANAMKGKKAVNYWWGMSADVIDVICAQDMPHGTHRLIEFLKNSIRAGSFHPFDGLIYSQNGVIRCKEGESLGPDAILTMNWLAENVIGRVPEPEELTDEARMLQKLQGADVDEKSRTEE
ncbi:MAG: BMP family ABC transporter substrate-binding protein [Hungatella sp.]|nr:BMP family ABC transporter substrate-binding protein [Hungatella sp.]